MNKFPIFLLIFFLSFPLFAQENYKNEFYIGRGYQKISWADKYKNREMTLAVGVKWWYSDYFYYPLFTSYTLKRTSLPSIRCTINWPKHRFCYFFAQTSSPYATPAYGKTLQATNNTYLNAFYLDRNFKSNWCDFYLGLSFINHHKDVGNIDENSLDGNIPDTSPSRIYIWIFDDYPDDTDSGAVFYGGELYINGNFYKKIDPTTTSHGGSGSVVGNVAYVQGYQYLYYYIDLTSYPYLDMKKIEVVLDLANDYKVELRGWRADRGYFPYPYITLQAEGNVKDYSNRGRKSMTYGVVAGNRIYGVNLNGKILGVNFKTEYCFSQTFRKFPHKYGERFKEEASIFYFRGERKFGKFLVGGDYFYTQPMYKSGIDGYCINDGYNIQGAYPYTSTVYFYYNDPNWFHRIPGWEDDFLSDLKGPRWSSVGLDRNNNTSTPDDMESDGKPDYLYDLDLKGYGIFLGYDLLKNLNVRLDYDDFKKITTDEITRQIGGLVKYNLEIPKYGSINLEGNLKKIEDTIRNPVGGANLLDYRDSIRGTAGANAKFSFPQAKNISFNLKCLSDHNFQLDRNNYLTWFGLIFRVNFDLLPRKLCFIPFYKLLIEDGYTSTYMLKLQYRIFEKTSLNIGTSVKAFINPFDSYDDYRHNYFEFQILSKAAQWQLIIGYEIINESYLINPSRNNVKRNIWFGVYTDPRCWFNFRKDF